MTDDEGRSADEFQLASDEIKNKDMINQLSRRRGSIKCRLTNFRKFVDTFEGIELNETQRTELNLRMQGAQNLLVEFTKIQNHMENIVAESELENLLKNRESFESDYYGTLAKTQCMIKSAKVADCCKSQHSSPNSPQLVKLPTISLPTFDGSYEHWLEFRDTFSSLVHSSQEITNIQKFHYLKSSLKGNAQLVIDSLEFSADNYSIAWELLLNRYDNSRLLVHNHVKALFSIQHINNESPAQLRKLIDTILKNLRALKLLGEPTEHWDTLIIYLMVSKLDSTTEREWEQYKSTLLPKSHDSKPALRVDDLLKFVRDRADMLETLIVSHSKTGSHTPQDTKKSFTRALSTPKLHCNILTENKPADKSHVKSVSQYKLCAMCKGKHPLYSCQAFLDIPLQDKYKLIQSNHLCENCLRQGHAANDCRYGPCRKCNKKHNSLIHKDDEHVPSVSLHAETKASTSFNSAGADANGIAHAQQPPRQVNNAHIDINAQLSKMQAVLLSTALVEIPDNLGNYHMARTILDSGSECCIITQSLCNKIKPKMIQSIQTIRGVGNSVSQCSQKCEIEIKSLVDTFSTRIQCLVMPQLTSTLPTVTISRDLFKIPGNVNLADPTFYEGQSIDLLLGADVFWDLLDEGKLRLVNGPYLQNTKLGWIVSGPIQSYTRTKTIRCNFTQSINMNSLDDQLRRFWEIEDLPISPKLSDSRSEEERACEDHFVTTTKRVADGRFCVQIPLKESVDVLGDSRAQAERRFYALEKRLQTNPAYKDLYKEFMNEYIQLGHMSRVDSYGTPHYFMPHHGVFREHATTTKLRAVFDASAASTSGKSFNDLQLVGPPIQGDLLAILLRFRENRYVACADVEKMYRQVLIDEKQRDLQLVLWRDSPINPLDVYQLKTVTYGTASAPFLSCRCLKQLAQDCSDPEVAKIINDSFYVDDFICSLPDKAKLIKICDDVTKVLDSGCFPLRKWVFNFDSTGQDYAKNASKQLSLGEHAQSKTLGLGWYNDIDKLHYYSRHDNLKEPVTKRTILSCTAQVFDPLGLLSPFITIAKILLQKLWLLKLDWDEPVPDDVTRTWRQFVNKLSLLDNVRVPRGVMCNNPVRKELHVFTDASQLAYGSCAYIRTLDDETAVTVRLLCAKGRVASLTPMTIPRLELMGACVGSRLYIKIRDSLRCEFDNVTFWTDSTVVLGWLRMPPNMLKTFVQNRTAEINELTKGCLWRHVSGIDNPADLVTRGQHLEALIHSSLWWDGPEFLRDPNLNCSNSDLVSLPESQLPELKSGNATSLMCSQTENELFPFHRFSQFNRLKRAACYVLRFIHNARAKDKNARRAGALTVSELNQSEAALARLAQAESFAYVKDALNNKQMIKGNLSKLNLFMEKNLIRVGGRIEYSPEFSFDKKHPVLLSSNHHFTLLLFRFEHKRLFHSGPQLLLFSIREAWWPVGGRNLARKVVHSCVTCVRMRGKILTPIMGNLPKERLDPGFPFLNCGVDYAGPVLILNRKGRGAQTKKAYICLFICFTTRAVHLELVSDLSSDAYLLALKRFISRRGKPATIFSDNGKNFVGLRNDFAKFLNSCGDEIKEYATAQSIKFTMAPPYASHFGGMYEAGFKSCKHHLRRVIGNAHLTHEEFSTVLTQVEAILNSRPLSPMSTDPQDYTPLSPAHFLVGRPLTAPASSNLMEVPAHRLSRYQRVEQIRQHFWTRWSKEYVSELQVRTKWTYNTADLKQDILVLIKEDNAPPLKWSLGRITRTFPGKDGVARVADIRTAHGIVRRAFSKICPLPVEQ